MPTLGNYNSEVRRLLHDANAQYWTDSELTDYINSARNRVVRDSGCLRSLQSFTLTIGQDAYTTASIGSATPIIDLLNVNVIWGTSIIPLYYMPWSQFNAQLRYWQNNQGRPVAWSMYGHSQFYLRPKPDQTYSTEIDTVVTPIVLVNTNDVDTIPYPFTDAVAYYAAYKAKFKEQSYTEAQAFEQQYLTQIQAAIRSSFTRRLPSPF
jgi:hypothetical protein